MGQTQNGFQGADEGASRGALLRWPTGLDLHFGDFQIPVAVLVPHKFINGRGHIVQTVFFKAVGDIRFHLLQHRGNPAVGLAELHVLVKRTGGNMFAVFIDARWRAFGLGVFLEAAVLALAVH
jgi:hypothetical protein